MPRLVGVDFNNLTRKVSAGDPVQIATVKGLAAGVVAAVVLMGAGVWLHLTERHKHEHVHEAMEHEHMHTHDVHDQHHHSPDAPSAEPHSHWHRHGELAHSHPHFPDIHPRHSH